MELSPKLLNVHRKIKHVLSLASGGGQFLRGFAWIPLPRLYASVSEDYVFPHFGAFSCSGLRLKLRNGGVLFLATGRQRSVEVKPAKLPVGLIVFPCFLKSLEVDLLAKVAPKPKPYVLTLRKGILRPFRRNFIQIRLNPY